MSEVKQNYYIYYSGYCGESLQERAKVLRDVEITNINDIWALGGIGCGGEVMVDKYDGTMFTITTVEIYKEKNNKKPSKEDFLEWCSGDYGGEYDYEKIAESYEETEMERADRIEQENLELKKENAELKKKIAELEKEKNA